MFELIVFLTLLYGMQTSLGQKQQGQKQQGQKQQQSVFRIGHMKYSDWILSDITDRQEHGFSSDQVGDSILHDVKDILNVTEMEDISHEIVIPSNLTNSINLTNETAAVPHTDISADLLHQVLKSGKSSLAFVKVTQPSDFSTVTSNDNAESDSEKKMESSEKMTESSQESDELSERKAESSKLDDYRKHLSTRIFGSTALDSELFLGHTKHEFWPSFDSNAKSFGSSVEYTKHLRSRMKFGSGVVGSGGLDESNHWSDRPELFIGHTDHEFWLSSLSNYVSFDESFGDKFVVFNPFKSAKSSTRLDKSPRPTESPKLEKSNQLALRQRSETLDNIKMATIAAATQRATKRLSDTLAAQRLAALHRATLQRFRAAEVGKAILEGNREAFDSPLEGNREAFHSCPADSFQVDSSQIQTESSQIDASQIDSLPTETNTTGINMSSTNSTQNALSDSQRASQQERASSSDSFQKPRTESPVSQKKESPASRQVSKEESAKRFILDYYKFVSDAFPSGHADSDSEFNKRGRFYVPRSAMPGRASEKLSEIYHVNQEHANQEPVYDYDDFQDFYDTNAVFTFHGTPFVGKAAIGRVLKDAAFVSRRSNLVRFGSGKTIFHEESDEKTDADDDEVNDDDQVNDEGSTFGGHEKTTQKGRGKGQKEIGKGTGKGIQRTGKGTGKGTCKGMCKGVSEEMQSGVRVTKEGVRVTDGANIHYPDYYFRSNFFEHHENHDLLRRTRTHDQAHSTGDENLGSHAIHHHDLLAGDEVRLFKKQRQTHQTAIRKALGSKTSPEQQLSAIGKTSSEQELNAIGKTSPELSAILEDKPGLLDSLSLWERSSYLGEWNGYNAFRSEMSREVYKHFMGMGHELLSLETDANRRDSDTKETANEETANAFTSFQKFADGTVRIAVIGEAAPTVMRNGRKGKGKGSFDLSADNANACFHEAFTLVPFPRQEGLAPFPREEGAREEGAREEGRRWNILSQTVFSTAHGCKSESFPRGGIEGEDMWMPEEAQWECV